MILSQSAICGKVFPSLLFIFLLPLNTIAQTDTTKTDTARKAPEGSRHAMYGGMGYGSNMIYMGSTISQNQPFEYVSITYGFKGEFFASISAVHLTDYNPFIAFYSGSLNYTHVFNSWLDIAAGVYRYQIAPSLADTLFGSFTYGDLAVGLDWNLLYSKISAGGLLSDQNRFYLQIKNSRYFQTPEFFKKKLYVSFDPYVNVLFGTLIEAETKTGTTIKVIPRYGRWKHFLQHTTYSSYNQKFGFMEVDFGVPVALNSDKMTIEAELCYILPGYDDNDLPAPKGFVFLLGGIFRIF